MQTFLCNWIDSPSFLDNKRLGKQRVEAYQILRVLHGETKGWRNHPAVLMWRGHEFLLARYGLQCCREWVVIRGFQDHLMMRYQALLQDLYDNDCRPAWWGDERLSLSHKSNLIRKDPAFYRPLWPDVPDDLPYYWPVTKDTLALERVLDVCP